MMSAQYRSSSTIFWSPRTCPSMRRRRLRFLVFASGSTATAFLSVMREIYIPPRGMSSLFGSALVEFRPARDDPRILPAVGGIRAAHASVVSKERLRKGARSIQVVRENCHTMADVRFDIEEVARPAIPVAGVEG